MSAETIKSEDGGAAESLPRADDLLDSQVFLADWARAINEREQAAGDEQQAASRKPASARRGLEKHFGRHRDEAY
jgi:hypothetical protein